MPGPFENRVDNPAIRRRRALAEARWWLGAFGAGFREHDAPPEPVPLRTMEPASIRAYATLRVGSEVGGALPSTPDAVAVGAGVFNTSDGLTVGGGCTPSRAGPMRRWRWRSAMWCSTAPRPLML